MNNYKVKVSTGEVYYIRAKNANLAYGLVRKDTGKTPCRVEKLSRVRVSDVALTCAALAAIGVYLVVSYGSWL